MKDCPIFERSKISSLKSMTIEDIRALVAADESRTLELKKSTGELKDGMHEACALLMVNMF